jgi:hypothetical protein
MRENETPRYRAVIPRFRADGDGGPAGWYAVYGPSDEPVGFHRDANDAKRQADTLNQTGGSCRAGS